MLRDELMNRLSALPEGANIGVQLGTEHLNVTDLTPWGDKGFVDLQCDAADLRDVLLMLGLPAAKRDELVGSTGFMGMQD